jgi:hypothetical protein
MPGRARLTAIILTAFFLLPGLLSVRAACGAEGDAVESRVVEASGFAAIAGGNVVSARDAAIDDAMRKAVEQAVGTLVAAETIVENYGLLSDNVYTRTRGYVSGYTVTGEGQAGGLYQVNISATVAVGAIKDDLDAIGLVLAKAGRPRVLFMVAEQQIGRVSYYFWWGGKAAVGATVDLSASETALKEAFIAKGFSVVDISGSTGVIETEGAFRVVDLADEGARGIGLKLNAEVVVKGKALAKEGPRTPGSQVGSYIADVTAAAIRVDDGAVLASARGHGVSRNVSAAAGGAEALSRASTDLASRLMDQIIDKWSKGFSVTLTLRGVTDHETLARLRESLRREVRGVKAVYQRSFSSGVAVLELDSMVPAQKIADGITGLPERPLKVISTTTSTIEAEASGERR